MRSTSSRERSPSSRHPVRGLGLGVAVLLLVGSSPVHAEPAFVPVAPLDAASFESSVADVSDDGLATAGWSDSNEGVRATRWTEAAGPVSLGSWFMPQPADRHSEANAISGDGNTVVGWSRVDSSGAPQFPDRRIAFQWTEAGGFDVYPLSGGVEAVAVDVSFDGSTIVGFQRASTSVHGFSVRFIDNSSPVSVGIPCCNPFIQSQAAAVSADGSRITGGAFYLTFGGTRLSYLTGSSLLLIGSTSSGEQVFATDVTPDGSLVIGNQTDSGGTTANDIFQWTEAGGFTSLGEHPPSLNTRMYATNADASVMVGQGFPSPDVALIWRTGTGFEELQTVAVSELGLDLTGWTLTSANSITPDGNAIVGDGINPQGVAQGWVLYLEAPGSAPPVPLAGGAGTLGLVAFLLGAGLSRGTRARARG